MAVGLSATIILFSFSGCWDSKDIEQKDIHITEAIDYKDKNFIYYGEVANLSGNSQSNNKEGNNNQAFNIISAKGNTLVQARDALERKSGKTVYLGACRLLVFTDRIADFGLEEYFNRTRTQNETRKSLRLVTTSLEPEELLKAKPDNSLSTGLTIDNIINKLTSDGSAASVNIGNILEALAVKKVGFLIPDFNITDSYVTLTGYTVFKNSKSIGKFSAEDSKGMVCFLNPNASFVYDVYIDNRKYNATVHLKKKTIKPIYTNGRLDLNININFTAELNYADNAYIPDNNEISRIQLTLSETIKKDIVQALEVSQNRFKSDYLGIYRYFRGNYDSDFKTLNWEQIYTQADNIVQTEVEITNSNLPQN